MTFDNNQLTGGWAVGCELLLRASSTTLTCPFHIPYAQHFNQLLSFTCMSFCPCVCSGSIPSSWGSPVAFPLLTNMTVSGNPLLCGPVPGDLQPEVSKRGCKAKAEQALQVLVCSVLHPQQRVIFNFWHMFHCACHCAGVPGRFSLQ